MPIPNISRIITPRFLAATWIKLHVLLKGNRTVGRPDHPEGPAKARTVQFGAASRDIA